MTSVIAIVNQDRRLLRQPVGWFAISGSTKNFHLEDTAQGLGNGSLPVRSRVKL